VRASVVDSAGGSQVLVHSTQRRFQATAMGCKHESALENEEALQAGPLEVLQFSNCETSLPKPATRASDASALIVAWTSGVSVRPRGHIVEIGAVCGLRVELGIEKVVLLGLIIAARRRSLPQSVVGRIYDAGY